MRREHRRRLVEDEQARAAIELLDDLDPLLRADREFLDARIRIELQPGALRSLGGPDPNETGVCKPA